MLKKGSITHGKLSSRWIYSCVIVFLTCFAFVLVPVKAAAIGLSSKKCSNATMNHYCRGNTGVQAVFWTMHKDGTQTLVTKRMGDDSVTGFMSYEMPPWHLNEGLSLFFQVPVYERLSGVGPHTDARTPV